MPTSRSPVAVASESVRRTASGAGRGGESQTSPGRSVHRTPVSGFAEAGSATGTGGLEREQAYHPAVSAGNGPCDALSEAENVGAGRAGMSYLPVSVAEFGDRSARSGVGSQVCDRGSGHNLHPHDQRVDVLGGVSRLVFALRGGVGVVRYAGAAVRAILRRSRTEPENA